ncbi:MAG: OmpA family protein [Clostridia bacterium]|nr:OmpA family protein [Clostridia bacterium]
MKKIIALVLGIVFLAASFSGCAAESIADEVAEIVIIASNRACNKVHNYMSDDLQEAIYTALSSGGKVSVISLDGNPSQVGSLKAELENVNPAAKERNIKAASQQITNELKSLKAVSAESDLLSALAQAANIFRESKAGKKIVYILDNGLQTCGYLNMTKNILSKNSDLIVEKLAENNYIPDFRGVDEVVVQNLGEVAAPQQNLTPNMKESLTQLWKKIFDAAGSQMKYVSDSLGNQNPDDFPPVSTVPIIEDEPLISESLDFKLPFFISESQISFLPNSSELKDGKNQALKILRPVAEYMSDHPSFHLLIAGCCAGDSDSDFGRSLSSQRADVISTILTEDLNVDKSRIETTGTGASNPWHISGITDLSSELAATNRVCVLIDASTRADYGI